MNSMGLFDRLQHAWNAFIQNDKGPPGDATFLSPKNSFFNYGMASSYRPDRIIVTRGQERSIINTIFNRIAVDVSMIDFKHVKLDDNYRFKEEMHNSLLDERLTEFANKDQTSRDFIRDIVISMFDEGCVAVVPVDLDEDPNDTETRSILSWRTGKILEWFPDDVLVEVYDDTSGIKKTIKLPKKDVAIIENPFYAIMNQPNSILQRLNRKFALLDVTDAENASGKLNIIVQLPYVIKTTMRREQAEQRRKDIEGQLAASKYGIAYTDGTEHITQLNRPMENNLMKQIEYLTSMVLAQLGVDESILNGTADEKTMLNYTTRVLVPIACAITEEMSRKFLTKTARTQKQTIMYFNTPFKLVPVSQLADIADKFTRNEIMTSNEMRQVIGLVPSTDPDADVLRNKNLNKSENVGTKVDVNDTNQPGVEQ